MFFTRLSNGWEIAKQSWQVLKRDKALSWFPFFGGIAAILVFASFALPIIAIPGLRSALDAVVEGGAWSDRLNDRTTQVVVAILGFAFYLLNYFVIVYFNTAFAACAVDRFRGGDPNVRFGLKMANQRLPQIVGWSLLAATVGIILHLIEEKSEWLGRLVAGILGVVWTAATFLVLPTLAVEGLGPVEALKRSGSLVRQVWGEGLAGNFGIGLIGLLLMLPALLLVVLAFVADLPPVVSAVVVAATIVYALGVSVITTALKQIFIAGLYVYATEKKIPQGFQGNLMRNAFVPKRS
jgi:hypothetical protein